jgi:hypothetical protein
MDQQTKRGPRNRGLTITKTFKLTPQMNRDLQHIARQYPAEGDVIRLALRQFFLLHSVQETDTTVQTIGQAAELAAA